MDGVFPPIGWGPENDRKEAMQLEDAQIIRCFWERDQAALQETERAYGARLYQLAVRILGNHEDAEECVSDTYLQAWRTIPPQRPERLFAYLAKLCRFNAFGKLDWQNAKKRKAEIVELTAEMECCIPDPGKAQELEGAEIVRLLSGFLKGLSKESRLIFLRRYWYAESILEIARRYGISESKVKTNLFRTRNKLRAYLESEGMTL